MKGAIRNTWILSDGCMVQNCFERRVCQESFCLGCESWRAGDNWYPLVVAGKIPLLLRFVFNKFRLMVKAQDLPCLLGWWVLCCVSYTANTAQQEFSSKSMARTFYTNLQMLLKTWLVCGDTCSLISALFRDFLSEFKDKEEGQGAKAVNPCLDNFFFFPAIKIQCFSKYIIPLPFLHLAIPFSWHIIMKWWSLVSFGRAWGMWRELFYILNQVFVLSSNLQCRNFLTNFGQRHSII